MRRSRIVLGAVALLLTLGVGYWQLLPAERRSSGSVPDARILEMAATTKAATPGATGAKPADAGKAAAPAMSFGDKRPLDTPAAETAAPTASPSFKDERLATAPAAVAPAAEAAPSFKDERLTTAPAGQPAATETPSFRDQRLAGPTVGATETEASRSFRDERLATPAGVLPDVKGTPTFRDERLASPAGAAPAADVKGAPTFRDERLASPAGAPPAADAPGAPTFRDERLATAPGTEPPATPSFRDTRVTAAPGFSDERPLQPPSFRDKRGIDAPRFSDDRPVAATPSFRDERGVGAPSFRDERSLGVPDEPDGGTQVALAPTLKLDPAKCAPPEVSAEPVDGGRMSLRAHAACQANQTVRIAYGGAELIRTLDASGNLDFTLDCFAGAGSPVEVRFADGTRKSVPVAAYELDKVSKIAVIWRAAVNLDLHVFEYAARYGQPGHLWAKTASSLSAARSLARSERRGRGFISSTDSEDNPGDKIEVYTFLHDDEQTSGAVGLALDYETRGETPGGATCGNGALAEVDFQVVVLPRGGNPARQSGVLTRVDCGTKLTADTRFSQSTLPSLRIRK